MSFLDPLLLWALPLSALPVIIHLINQRRFQTIDWGAMRFLLEANRMARGYARIRQWIILAVRTLAIGGLIFAVSRPLVSGRLGLAVGGRADTTLILIDRSPSMQQRGTAAADSKLARGVDQIAKALETVGSSRWVLIDSVSPTPQELHSPAALRTAPHSGPASASADLPAMLQAAHDYIDTNQAGQTEIWICSDMRSHDWRAESSEWPILRDAFKELEQGVRFHLLAFPESAPNNLAVRVTNVRPVTPLPSRQDRDGDRKAAIEDVLSPGIDHLSVSLVITRDAGDEHAAVPVQFEVGGVRSEVTVEMTGREATLENHVLPIDAVNPHGWGRVSIPADANEADNEYYFTFAELPTRRTVIVAENAILARPLQLAASLAPDAVTESPAEIVAPPHVATLAWEDTSLLLWHAPLPRGAAAQALENFVLSGGQAVFFPPRRPDDATLFGVRWGAWNEPEKPLPVDAWRSDQDIIARTRNGTALPVGSLMVHRYCSVEGDTTPLATLRGGELLWARASLPNVGAYFCATTVDVADSSLARDGVVLYAAVQRALEAGARRLLNAQQRDASDPLLDLTDAQRLAGAEAALSSEAEAQAGVYATAQRLTAVNRSAAEDQVALLDDARVNSLFAGLDYDRVDARVDAASALAREIWRLFLGAMIAALVSEAFLCLPKSRTRSEYAA